MAREGEKKRRRKRKQGEKKKREKRRLQGCGTEECKKVQLNAERKCRRKRGNLWVKTCFLGKGLSPSKLSTKALCGDTRKRGNEKPERESLSSQSSTKNKAIPAPTSSLASLTYNREPVMLARQNLTENLTQQRVRGWGSQWDHFTRNR